MARGLIIYFSLILRINFCGGRNASLDIFLPPRSLEFESQSEELSNQKQYVVRLNAKVLARERERLEKHFHQNELPSKNIRIEHVNFVENPGKMIGSYLRKISNEELCVTTMQAIYDTLPSVDSAEDSQTILNEVTKKLETKIKEYVLLLEKNKFYIENIFVTHKVLFDVTSSICCQLFPETLSYYEHFGINVDLEKGCVSFPYSHFPTGLYIGKNLSTAFKSNLKRHPSLLWQYYISSDGAHFEYPAHNLGYDGNCDGRDDRHRHIYQDTVKFTTKYVILVIDQSSSLTPFQFENAKIIGKHILQLLSSHDKIIIFGLAADIQYHQGHSCEKQKMLYATIETKLALMRFLDELTRKPNITDHVLGFRTVYDIIHKIENNNHSIKNEILVAYISRGLLSSLTDAKQVLEIIADGNQVSRNHIVINTYAVMDDERLVMYEKDFLQAVAEQNFRKYNIRAKKSQEVWKGVMIPINSTKDISATIGDIFAAFPDHLSTKPRFSLPYFDTLSKGIVLSLSQQVFHNEKLIGVTGIDVSLTDVTEDISYFINSQHRYVFLLDKSGIALTHPSFSHPTYASWHQFHTYIWHLEDKPGFQDIYKDILRYPSGERIISFKLFDDSKRKHGEYDEKIALYQWKRVENTPYIVCIVNIEPSKIHKVLKNYIYSEEANFSYHRLDLIPTTSSCRHMKQLSSLGTTALFLSASCFTSPYKYLMEEETQQTIQNYMTYLKDSTKFVSNPGLKTGIRSEVLALSQITSSWKIASQDKEFSNYIVRRFIATNNGVFQVYPATLIDKSYDATRRDWYIRALEHPGKIILTAPYLDVGGAGYVITLSHTIYEGKPAALHNTGDNVVAVMGMDFTFGYFYKYLIEKLPICKHDRIICFLLDDKGYLVSHPDLIEPNGRGPVEQQHITHKEPLVANDLLNHRDFVSKKVCNSYSDRTIQRYYQLNMSLDTVLTNIVHGEPCTKYQVMSIHGTNVFLGIVNRTCDGITAFCPCSMTDRLCLNCHRMEPTECECPCECPLKMDLCNDQLLDENNRYPTCPHFPELPNLPLINMDILERLQPCYEHHCSSRLELSDCFGVLGCEWCQLESDGITPLPKKFCTEQRKCFGGVLGAKTPYADEIIEDLPEGEFLIIRNTPVGPVAGGFMVFFLVVALGVYCYCNHVRRGTVTHFNTSSPDTNFRMTQLNNEPDEIEPYKEPLNSAPMCQLLPRAENVVSPYRIPTNYRRPTTGDSDHGYSTMTPHEDSELAHYFEPSVIGKDRHIVPVSQNSLSSDSRTSSPLSCPSQSIVSTNMFATSLPHHKLDSLPTSWVAQKDMPHFPDIKLCGNYVLAHAQVHSENLD